jgi:hypothetical protein
MVNVEPYQQIIVLPKVNLEVTGGLAMLAKHANLVQSITLKLELAQYQELIAFATNRGTATNA